jgi:hypothetical protein
MDKTPLLLAGPILSALGLYYRPRRRSVKTWMNERRIGRRRIDFESIGAFLGATTGCTIAFAYALPKEFKAVVEQGNTYYRFIVEFVKLLS